MRIDRNKTGLIKDDLRRCFANVPAAESWSLVKYETTERADDKCNETSCLSLHREDDVNGVATSRRGHLENWRHFTTFQAPYPAKRLLFRAFHPSFTVGISFGCSEQKPDSYVNYFTLFYKKG